MNALTISDLSKSYGDFCLDRVNLTLPSGCIMGLIGENGAGKTTLIKLIMDMIARDSGTITVLGRDNQHQFSLIKEDIGIVLDDVGISECLTAGEVNRIMKHMYRRWDEQFFFDLLADLSVPANKKFKTFSRGMRMKLGIAMALSHHPKLLLLDEATSGLDPVVRDQVIDLFCEFTRDPSHAILISSHIVSDLEKICDYVAFLHKGRLLLCEEKDRLREQYGILHCTPEELRQLPLTAVIGKRTSPYGVDAIVDRTQISPDYQPQLGAVDIEQLFVLMAKEEN